VCVPECPEDAIYAVDDVPEDQRQFIEINAKLALLWEPLTKSKASMPAAAEWSGVANKQQYLARD
jgi:ferredoxin